MKILFFISLFIIHVQLIGQTNNDTLRNTYIQKTYDSISELNSDIITVNIKKTLLTKNNIEKGFYKVLKIDNFNNFYLIFVEKNKTISTIYSEKIPFTEGQKLEIGGIYYFELVCKNYFKNGICYHPVCDVTYFKKYKGCELGKLYIAKNLCGINIIN